MDISLFSPARNDGVIFYCILAIALANVTAQPPARIIIITSSIYFNRHNLAGGRKAKFTPKQVLSKEKNPIAARIIHPPAAPGWI